MDKTPKIRVGVIGTGRIGKLHIQHLAQNIPEADLVALCSLDRPSMESLAETVQCPTDHR